MVVVFMVLAGAACTHGDALPDGSGGPDRPALVAATQAPVPATVGALPATDVAGFHRLLQQMSGTPVVVNVWAAWCVPCTDEAPLLVAAAREHPEVQFLGVDFKDSRGGAVRWLAEHGVNYPSLFDPAGAILTDLAGVGPPMTVFYDAQGVQRAKVPGLLSRSALDDGLAQIDPTG